MNTSLIMRAAAVVMAVAAAPGGAQEAVVSLSLQESLERFARNSPELGLARSRLRAALGNARQGRAIPNPTASITNEDLGQSSERYFNLSQRVDFFWEGGSRGRRAEARVSEARAAFQVDSARMALDLKRAFVDAWRQARVLSALGEVDGVVAEVLDDARIRFELGDLAGYDLRRLRLARASVGRRLMRADVALAEAERRLGSLVVADVSLPRIRPEGGSLEAGVVRSERVDFGDAVDRALALRPELAAARSATEALSAEATLARTSMLAGSAVTGGFKQQSDGRSGLFLGVQLPIPLLDRRGGAVDAAQAEVDGSESRLDLLRLVVAREAALADSRLRGAQRQQALLGDSGVAEAAELLSTARVAYDEGEVGIVELVDAADAFLEARLLDSSVRAELWIAFHELEHAIGGFPREGETGVER